MFLCDTIQIMEIRKGKKKDAEEIAILIQNSILATHTEIYPQDEINHKLGIYSEERVKEYMDKGEYFVAVEGNKIIGCVLAKDENMRSLYVLPEYMRKGVGNKLAQKAEDCIREKEYDYVNIWASLVAVEFYKGRGYKIIGDIKNEQGRVLHKEMKKDLV